MPPISNCAKAPDIACAENIALCLFLHPIPERPSQNPVTSLATTKEGYILPFDKERALANILAFLAKSKDGSDYIPAICVEEDKRSHLNVLLAINKRSRCDGDYIHRELKHSFEKIFAVLSTASYDKTSDIEEKIFAEIISMCSARILCRLRIHSKGQRAVKRPTREALQEALSCIKRIDQKKVGQRNLTSTFSSFLLLAKKVIRLIGLWTKHQTQVPLGNIVDGFHCLQQVEGLRSLLGLIPPRDMDPSAKTHLLNVISKVSRYREAARLLYRIAKKFPIARQMITHLVSLPNDAFNRSPISQSSFNLHSTLSRIGLVNGRQGNVREICDILNISEHDANSDFLEQAGKSLNESKIHAEMQLIAFCELRAPEFPPRVICSSKDACYLCNCFITMYSKMHTPKSHGRLYPGWRLPHLLQFKSLELAFNQALESHINQSLSRVLANRRRAIYPYPNESTILTISPSSTTVSSTVQPREDGEIVRPQHVSSPASASCPPIWMETFPQPRGTECTHSLPSSLIAKAAEGSLESVCPRRADKEVNASCALLRGRIVSGSFGPRRRSVSYIAGSLKIRLECDIDTASNSDPTHKKPFGYNVEWLTAESADEVRGLDSVIDVESLDRDLTLSLSSDNKSLFLATQHSMLKIIFCVKED